MTDQPNHAKPHAAKAWREAMGYTQDGLARALCVSRSTVQTMERGTRPDGSPIRPDDWQRYALQCAGLWQISRQGPWTWPLAE